MEEQSQLLENFGSHSSRAAAAAFAAYLQLKEKFDTAAVHNGSDDVTTSYGSTMGWKILGKWKILEVNKIHVLVNKNLTKMEFRRITSKSPYKKHFTEVKC